jgi:hypothetical protein
MVKNYLFLDLSSNPLNDPVSDLLIQVRSMHTINGHLIAAITHDFIQLFLIYNAIVFDSLSVLLPLSEAHLCL